MKKSYILLFCCILSACNGNSDDQNGGNKNQDNKNQAHNDQAGTGQTGLNKSPMVELLKSFGCTDSDIEALKSGQPVSDRCRINQERVDEAFVARGWKKEEGNHSKSYQDAKNKLTKESAEFFGCNDKALEECENARIGMNRLDGKEPTHERSPEGKTAQESVQPTEPVVPAQGSAEPTDHVVQDQEPAQPTDHIVQAQEPGSST